jgi:hypothetical protein
MSQGGTRYVTGVKIAVGARAQVELPEADVTFCIRDQVTKQPLGGVAVVVELPEGTRRTMVADDEGRVRLVGKSAGRWRLIEVRHRRRLPVRSTVRR